MMMHTENRKKLNVKNQSYNSVVLLYTCILFTASGVSSYVMLHTCTRDLIIKAILHYTALVNLSFNIHG